MGDVYIDITVINDSQPDKNQESLFHSIERARAMKAK